MRDRATAALVALALAGVAFPPFAMAQSIHTTSGAVPMTPADEVMDTGGWSLRAFARPSEGTGGADPLAPEGHAELAEPRSAEQPTEISEASRPRMVAGELADSDKPPSETVSIVTNWIIASGDNGGLPFIVIDKVAAMVFLFDAEGQFIGATPALLGITAGDDSAPGVGDRELSDIKPEDRTTPAGRFVAKFGLASGNRNVLWVDYETSISLHPVVTTNKKERRLQRLRSPTANDNRITFGCINIPAKFYDDMVKPLFAETNGIVYILPEFKYLFEVFPAFRPDARPQSRADVGR
ncbi:hypothetical protein LVY65_03935 [Sphingomonas sp. G124]|uniref:L,D-transpeptidase n=1 Tax=Sphingomonas cremea TaxID=2904799 RepID=A0A9X1QMS5_9SPHN|nr:hypothetical protein [Sphingomonas cremea]MCF2514219.1 hypothetical protein [Sphingomonas cremea]